MDDFKDKVVAVTGASSGVGRAIAEAFGAAGAKVALIARTQEALANAAATIVEAGGEALALPTDVASAEEVERAAAAIEAHWGKIDIWVNDAMVSVFAPAQETTEAEYARVTEVDYLGTVYGTLAALRRMVRRDDGVVVQIGSALAYCSIPLQSAYCASKAAIRGFTDSVRIELKHDRSNVRVCMLQLPAVNTPQFDVVRTRLPNRPQPVPPIFQPEVIARAVLYAARHKPREMWLGSPVWKAIVGRFLTPRLVEWFLARNGYESQQTSERALPRRDDVDQPIPGDRGSHGRFDRQSKSFSPAIWLRTHPWAFAGALALTVAGGAVAARR